MFGLAPMMTEDPSLLRRQFLHSFTTTGDQVEKKLEESYAFNGGESFVIGGTADDYHRLIDDGGRLNVGRGFENRPFTKKNIMLDAESDMNFAPMLYY